MAGIDRAGGGNVKRITRRWRRDSGQSRVSRRRLLLLLLSFTVAFASRGHAQSGPPAAVLDRFLGDWKTQAVIRSHGPSPRETRTRGQAVCRRTLEGRYVEFRTVTTDPPGEAELQIMTYDDAASVYRQWVFGSDGYRHEAVGRWDAATSTLRWEGTRDGALFVIDDRWVSPDRLEWSLTRTAADGRILQTIRGVVSR
jgi:hypothetical protein